MANISISKLYYLILEGGGNAHLFVFSSRTKTLVTVGGDCARYVKSIKNEVCKKELEKMRT